MARGSLLSGIAIAAGTGLAIGFCAFGRRRVYWRAPQSAGLEPLIERLDRIEARMNQSSPGTPEISGAHSVNLAAVRTSLANIDERLTAQSRELEFLRNRTAENEKIAEAEACLTESRFHEATRALPARIETVVAPRIESLREELLAAQAKESELLRNRAAENEKIAEAEACLNENRFQEAALNLPARIEAVVIPRMESLREHLFTEVKDSIDRSLQTSVHSFDAQVSSRIATLEEKLLEHSTCLAALSHQTSQTNANLQKLIDAVERLCDQRGPEPAPAPATERAPIPQPTYFIDASERPVRQASPEAWPTAPRALATAPEPSGWPLIRDEEPPRRSRVTFGHLLVAAAAALISARFAR